MALQYNHEHEQEITLFAETNFRNQRRRFGIKTDDRRRHMYIIGKTGMGKTTLLENLILSDIYAGHGCCYVDPHGDTAAKLVEFIPSHRINDVVYLNPADFEYPMGFNILETDNEEQKPLVASGLMGVFKKIWPDVWSARMEYILMNCVLALLDYPGATLMGINRLLVDKEYRERVVAKIRDPIVKTFWVAEFTSWSEKYATEAIAPVQNKVGQFLSSSVIRNIVAQVKSSINLRRIMDDGKILIANLSKGRIGEDNMRLLGGMLITKIQLAAQERQSIPNESDRRDFYLYVDEFQNFANESFATILSEARKYRLNLIVAHQYIMQLDEKVAAAIFGNVGTIITMRVGGADAEAMEMEFAPYLTSEDLVNLAKTQIYLKLMVDGVATPPFSANTLPPISKRTGNEEKVIAVSRERYAEPRAIIEEKVLKWSGMELSVPGLQTGEQGASLESVAQPTMQPIRYQTMHDQASIPSDESKPILETAPPSLSYLRLTTEDEQESVSTQKPTTEYLKINPERLAAIQAAIPQQQGKKKAKPQFTHVCTRCGKTWTLPIQLDPTRPMYCSECRPIVLAERKQQTDEKKAVMKELPPLAAVPDSESSETMFAAKSQNSIEAPNRPRIIRSNQEPEIAVPPVRTAMPLSDQVRQNKGGQFMNKKMLEKRAGDPLKERRLADDGMKKTSSRRVEGQKVDYGKGSKGPRFQQRDTKSTTQPPKVRIEDDQLVVDDGSNNGLSVSPGQRIKFDE